MDCDGGVRHYNTLERIFRDFKGRRAGIIKALTTDFKEFYQQCDPDRENLCLYGLANGEWEVNVPVEDIPSDVPEPTLGINFARVGIEDKGWLLSVAKHSDAWLHSVAFYFGVRLGLDKADRKRLCTMINDLPTVAEVVTGSAEKQTKEKSPVEDFLVTTAIIVLVSICFVKLVCSLRP